MSEGVQASIVAEKANAARMAAGASATCFRLDTWLDEPDAPDDPLISGLAERGEMLALVGQSKSGKSYFAAQLAVCVAAGVPFLGRETVRSTVYVANMEVSPNWYRRRLRKMVESLGLSGADLSGVFVDNLKFAQGEGFASILARAQALGASLVVVDPFYRLVKGDESCPEVAQAACDEMAKFAAAGVSLLCVFHSPKGFAADRQLVDMISGSSILARFPESIVGLLNHSDVKGGRVVRAILRNYPSPDDFAVRFRDGAFVVDSAMPATVETASTINTKQKQDRRTFDVGPYVLEYLREHGGRVRIGDLWAGVQKVAEERTGVHIGQKDIAARVASFVSNPVSGCVFDAKRTNEPGGGKYVRLVRQAGIMSAAGVAGAVDPQPSQSSEELEF